MQPSIPVQNPPEEEISRFRLELRRAYSYAPSHRAAGPGEGRNEHWSWMPQQEDAWQPIESLLLNFSLGKLPVSTMQALMSPKILAADRDDPNLVRPLALGIVHRRLVSNAVGRMFQSRVAVAVSPQEHSIGKKGGLNLCISLSCWRWTREQV